MNLKRFEKMKARGVRVTLDDNATAVYVFPVGVRHLGTFSRKIMDVLRKLGNVKVNKDEVGDEKAIAKAIGMEALPLIAEDLIELVEDTTVVGLLDQDDEFHVDADLRFEDLNHWDLPPVLEVWFDLNFGEEKKRRPWIAAVEKALYRLTGQKLSMRGLFSQSSSEQDTDAKTSSTISSSPTTA